MMQKSLLILFLVIFGNLSWGQIAITALNSSVSENFDNIGTSTAANLPSSWKMTAAGAGSTANFSSSGNFTTVSQAASSGSPATGGRYNWGSTASERAIGFMTSGSFASPNSVITKFVNSTSQTISSLSISFDYERYRINTAAAGVSFFYSLDDISWTAVTEGSGTFTTGSNAYNFASGTVISKTLSIANLSIPNAGNIYFKWVFNTTGSNSQGIGLDNFTLSAATSGLTVTYNTQGGSTVSNATTAIGGAIASSPGTPTKAGYSFNGWFVNSGGGNAITFPFTHGQTNDFTLYAQWTANTLNVSYDSQGGSSISNGSTFSGGDIPNSPGIPIKAGYTFTGWFTAASGGSAIIFPYSHGQLANFTLFAQWTANSLTVTFDSQGGNNFSAGTTTTGSVLANPGNPSQTGYSFNGWFSSPTGGTAINFPYSHGQVSDFTLYAQWTQILTPTIDPVVLLQSFTTTYGTASSSIGLTANGSALNENITISAQSGYEVSTDNTNFSMIVAVPSGSPYYLRISPTHIAGDFNDATLAIMSSLNAASVNIYATSSGNFVSAKALSITGISIENKQYDANVSATILGTPQYFGLENGESFTVSGSPLATFNNSTVGLNKPVLVSGYTAPSANYTLTQPSALTADISPVSLTIANPTVSDKSYDGNTNATILGTLTGFISGDDVAFLGTGTYADANASTGIVVTSSASLIGTSAGNYLLIQPLGLSGNITQANQTITSFPSTDSKTTAVSTYLLTATASSGLAISFTSSNPSVATINGATVTIVGQGNTVITAVQSGDNNYLSAQTLSQTLTVTLPPIYWDFQTVGPTSGVVSSFSVSNLTRGNNNGTTTLLTTTSASSNYTGSSGANNVGASAKVGALDMLNSAYFEFTITPTSGYQLEIYKIAFGSRSTGTGPTGYSVKSSLDNYTTVLALGSLSASSSWQLKQNDALAISNISSPVTIRIYGHSGSGNAVSGTANWRLDDLSVYYNVSCLAPNVSIISSTSTNSICIGESITLSGAGAATYQWDHSVVDGVAFTPTNTATYSVTGTDMNGCTNTTSTVITVNPIPVVVASSSAAVINLGSSVDLTASGANTYAWDNSSTTSVITVSPTSTTSYQVTGTSLAGCTATGSVTVTVNTCPTVVASASNSTVCAGASTTLTASGASTYAWDNGSTGSTITVNPTTTTTYIVSGTANGCTVDQTVTVTVNALPIVAAVAAPEIICSGSSTTLSVTGAASYLWNDGSTTSSITVSPTTTSTYTVVGVDANGCEATASVTVTVDQTVSPAFTQVAAICTGASLSALPTTSNNGIVGTWSPALN
ncbi:MAG: hypothetical protein RL751_546, partial [Bacteroidota bacterium]